LNEIIKARIRQQTIDQSNKNNRQYNDRDITRFAAGRVNQNDQQDRPYLAEYNAQVLVQD
jgi:hypothetical protein